MTIYETMRRLAPDFFVHCGDTIYADDPLARREEAAGRPHLEEPRRRRAKSEGRRNPGRLPRQPPLQLPRRQSPPLQRRSPDDRPVGRPRRPRQLVPGRSGSTPILATGKRARARWPRRAQRAFREFMPLADGLDGPMRLFRRSPSDLQLDVFRLDMRSFRAPNGTERPEVAGIDTAYPRPRPGRVAEAGAQGLDGHLEDRRTRTCRSASSSTMTGAAKSGFDGRRQCRQRPATRARIGDRQPAVLPEARGHPQRPLDHRRRALSSHPSLRSRRGPPSRTSRRSTNSSRGHSAPAASAPTRSTARSALAVIFQKVPPTGRFDLSPLEGSCHFGHVKIDGRVGRDDRQPSRRVRRHHLFARPRAVVTLFRRLDRSTEGAKWRDLISTKGRQIVEKISPLRATRSGRDDGN